MKTEFDMNNPYQVANSVIFSSDMLECAERLDRFVELTSLAKNKPELIGALFNQIDVSIPPNINFAAFYANHYTTGIEGRDKLRADEPYQICEWGPEVCGHYLSRELTRAKDLKPIAQLDAMRWASQKIKKHFAPPSGWCVDGAYIHQAMNHLEKEYSFVEKVFRRIQPAPVFLLYANSGKEYNGGIMPLDTFQNSMTYQIDLYHMTPRSTTPPEYLFFIHLGKILLLELYNQEGAPPDFMSMEIHEQFRQESLDYQRDLFAEDFALAVTYNNTFTKYVPKEFMSVPSIVPQQLSQYFKRFINQ